MRVLVTGGAGFIGSHIVDALIARGDEVTVLDDLSSGKLARLPDASLLTPLSIIDGGSVTEVVGKCEPDVIFHLAAQIDVRRSVTDPAHDAQVNVMGTINVLNAAQTVGARVLMASTGGAIYGRNAPIPTPESFIPEPEAPYGTGKYCGEQYIGLYNRLHGTRHVALRLANVYGPRQDPAGEGGVVSIFAGKAHKNEPVTVFGDGKQTRDFVYVGDVAGAFLTASGTDEGGVWNIGTGTETSVLDLVAALREVSGNDLAAEFADPRQGELPRSCLDVSAAKKALGWTAETELADGVRRVYEWVAEGEPPEGKAS